MRREEANLAVPQSSGQKSTSQPAPSPSGDFGANEWLVDEMYEQYKEDPKSVSPEWAKYFKTNGSGDQTDGGSGGLCVGRGSDVRADLVRS